MHHLIRLLLILMLWGSASQAFGESTEGQKEINWWIDLGVIGKVGGESTNGWGAASGFTLENRFGLFTLRNANYIDREGNIVENITECILLSFFNETCKEKNALRVEEWALLYGRLYYGGRVAISSGVSKVKGGNTINSLKYYSVYGLPLEVYWRPVATKHIGLAFMAIANLNEEESFAGVYLSLPVGKLK